MAKKTGAPKAPAAAPTKIPLVTIKGYPGWGDWLEDLARHSRTSKVGVIDRALTEFAARMGFRPPPDR